jgi:hypothetical protein
MVEVDWFRIVRIKRLSRVQHGRKKQTQQNATQELHQSSVYVSAAGVQVTVD